MKRILSISLLLITTTIALNGAFFHAFRQVASKVAPIHVAGVGLVATSLAAQYHGALAHEKKRLDANDPELIKTFKAIQTILRIAKEVNEKLTDGARLVQGFPDPICNGGTEKGLVLFVDCSSIEYTLFTPWGYFEIFKSGRFGAEDTKEVFDDFSKRIQLENADNDLEFKRNDEKASVYRVISVDKLPLPKAETQKEYIPYNVLSDHWREMKRRYQN